MTGASTLTAQVLVDGWPDDVIEADAWVEVTSLTSTELMALKILQRAFPEDEREESETYLCMEEKEFFKPAGQRQPNGHYVFEEQTYDPVEGPWIEADDLTPRDAKRFWRFRVVCPV